ncbi:MAG TPA: helix-turn-helix domain-containing protein [Vicinamibacteria bacterium]|jgi:DNA-binding NtrC family response regulator
MIVSEVSNDKFPFPPGFNLQEQVREYERNLIQNALAVAGGHQRRAARALGIRPTTLNEKMKRLGLRRDTMPQPEAGPVPHVDPRHRFPR